MPAHAGRRAPPVFPMLCALASACGTPERLPENADTAAPDAARGAPTREVARPGQPLPTGERDVGIGILTFSWHEDQPREGSADTVVIRERPDASAKVVARFIYTFGVTDDADAPWGWRTETTQPALVAADVEFNYEENGLPIDSIAGDAVRVIYAFTPEGTPKMGWARLHATLHAQRWSDILFGRNLHFFENAPPVFHTSPLGARVIVALQRGEESGRLDYTMEPLEISGEWMRVRVVTPSNQCFDPPNPAQHTAWIRYLDGRGRPHVFYAPRGC